jgi:hypothetical protein
VLELPEVAVGTGRAADRPAKEDVGREAVRAVDEEREVVLAVARSVQCANLERAALDRVAVREPRVGANMSRCVREERHAVPRRQFLDADDVIAVAVRAEHVRDRDALLFGAAARARPSGRSRR